MNLGQAMIGQAPISGLAKEKANETQRESGRLAKIVMSPRFDLVVSLVIVTQACVIGWQTQDKSRRPLEDDQVCFEIAETFFCVIFVLEMAARIAVFRLRFLFSPDWRWNALDSVVVTFAVTVEVAKYVLRIAGAGDPSRFAALRVMRVVRFLRLMRIVRTCNVFQELRILVLSISSTILSLLWTLVLLFIVMLTFGVHISAEVSNHEVDCSRGVGTCRVAELRPLFGSLTRTILTLYQSVLGGLDWGEVSDDLAEMSALSSMMFVIYVTFVIFAIMNTITGLFVEQAKRATAMDLENVVQDTISKNANMVTHLEQIFHEADSQGSGSLTWSELQQHLLDARVRAYFKTLDIDYQDLKTFFELLQDNADEEEPAVDIASFVSACMRLKGNAKSVDVMALRYEQRKLQDKLYGLLEPLRTASKERTSTENSMNIENYDERMHISPRTPTETKQ